MNEVIAIINKLKEEYKHKMRTDRGVLTIKESRNG